MSDPVEHGSRASAQRLTARLGAGLEAEVEAALYTRDAQRRPDQYLDPVSVSLGSLIVSVADLVWTMYKDLRKQTLNPSLQGITIRIRQQLDDEGRSEAVGPILDVVVEEVTKAARTIDEDHDRKDK